MKSLKISDETHEELKKFCKEKDLKINAWIETIIKNKIKDDKRKRS